MTGIVALAVIKMTNLAVRPIERCPSGNIGIHELCTHQYVSPVGVVGAIAVTGLDSIDITAALGNDVHNVNVLTVIATESYDYFAKGLQSELADAVADRPRAVTRELFINLNLM